MNALISFSWMREYLQTDIPVDVCVKRMSAVGNSVEHCMAQDAFLSGVVLGCIRTITPHPNADRLRVCMVDIGEKECVQIVCGGVNVAEGQWVAVAGVGARVRWHGGEPMVMEKTAVRGVESAGMICAAEELGFEGVPAGPKDIWDLGTVRGEAKVGTPIARVLGVEGDVILDVEVTTNRPDAMAIVGQVREAAAAGLGTMKQDPFAHSPVLPVGIEQGPEIRMESELCRRYLAARLRVRVGDSPWWMQKRLLSAGVRPINNVVDVTNYVRLEYGQPLHAFDAEKVKGALVLRTAQNDESFTALNGETYALPSTALVVADEQSVLALAGIMGGQESAVSESTKEILLEAAAFNALSVRKTSRAIHLASDSQALYEKGLPVELPAYAMARAIELLMQVADAEVHSGITDEQSESDTPSVFSIHPKRIGTLMGVDLTENTYETILTNLGFTVEKQEQDTWKVQVPFWRAQDIESDVDFTEEVARMYGYDLLPTILPSGALSLRQPDPVLAFIEKLRDVLVGQGYTELYSNTLIDPADSERAGFSASDALRLTDPLASDMSLLRTSLLPGTLRTLAEQEQTGEMNMVFEVGPIYLPRQNDIPEERPMLLIAHVAKEGGESLFRVLRGAVDVLANATHASCSLKQGNIPAWLHPGRSAQVFLNGQEAGVLGELHPDILNAFGFKGVIACAIVPIAVWASEARVSGAYQEAPPFPSILRDIAVEVPESISWASIEQGVRAVSPLFSRWSYSMCIEEKMSRKTISLLPCTLHCWIKKKRSQVKKRTR